MSPCDVKALFTLVPEDPSLNICTKLQQGTTLHSRTSLSIHNIMSLIKLCLKNTFFTFQGKYYEQVQGAAMGSPLSQVVTNLFMEDSQPPRIWLRFVEDIFIVHKAEHTQQFFSHLNSLDPNIQFTTKSNMALLPFLDTLISKDSNGSLITTVYRKPTHTDHYLHWDSQHSIKNKYSIYNTLSHRASMFASTNSYWNKKINTFIWHSAGVTTLNGYSTSSKQKWTSNSVNNNDKTKTSKGKKKNIFTLAPYSKVLCESFRNMRESWSTGTVQGCQHSQGIIGSSQG